MEQLKVVVMGAGGVGKSAITMRFVQGVFTTRYDPTIEDSYRKMLEIDGTIYSMEILDTAGTEQFTAMRDIYIKNGGVFVLVFSLTSETSFMDIDQLIHQIELVKSRRVPITIVGNKCDMIHEREVSLEKVNRYLNPMVEYIEVSAMTGHNVDLLFYNAVRQYKRTTPVEETHGKCMCGIF